MQALKDILVEAALYADKHNLHVEEGFWRFNWLAKRKKMKAYKTSKTEIIKYKFGYWVPQDWEEAQVLDSCNKNQKWTTTKELEMGQIKDYSLYWQRNVPQK